MSRKQFTLFTKHVKSPSKYGNDITSYIEVKVTLFDWPSLMFFTVSVPDKSFSHTNPFKALMMAVESGEVSAAKYNQLKRVYHLET